MGQQCQTTNHEEDYIQGFTMKYQQDNYIKSVNDVPKDVKLLKNFPKLSDKIIQVQTKLDTFSDIIPTNSKVYQLTDQSIFSGVWKKGKITGIGKLLLKDGTYIQSDFLNGRMNGKTRIIRSNGQYFNGKTKSDGKSFGVVHENSLTYQGYLLNNQPHGMGSQVGVNYTFVGQYLYGKKRFGKLEWYTSKNLKSIYEGGFKNDLFSGQGVLFNSQGQYRGNFQIGRKSGAGKLIYANGEVYQGLFLNNSKHGYGKLTNQKGEILYIGQWKNDRKILPTN